MIIALITIIISLVLSLSLSNKIFAPATIVAALWLFCIMAYWIYPHNLLALKDQFYIGISLWVGAFTFATLLTQSISQKSNNLTLPNEKIRNLYYILTLIN